MMQQRFYTISAVFLIAGLTGAAAFQQYTRYSITLSGKASFISKSSVSKTMSPVKPSPKIVRIHASRIGFPSDLHGLTLDPHVIVIGRVTGVLRVDTTPLDVSPHDDIWLGNHTVYSVEVEHYLKGTGPNNIKLRYDGGETQGILNIMDDVAHPTIGDRYLLFLQSSEQSPMVKRMGYLTVGVDGRTYRAGDADEYQLFLPQQSQVLLKDGRTFAVTDELHRDLPNWQFSSPQSAQIVGVTEAEAIASTEKAIAWKPVSPKSLEKQPSQ